MGINEILSALEAEGKKKEEKILADARQRAAEAEAAARLEVKEKRDAELSGQRTQAEQERTKIVTAAKLESKRKKLQAMAAMTQEVIDTAEKELGQVPDNSGYEAVFEALAKEVYGTSFEGGLAEVDPRDKNLADRVLRNIGFQGKIEANLACKGGLVLTAADHKVVADNRFEARLQRSEDFLRTQISLWLFGEEGT